MAIFWLQLSWVTEKEEHIKLPTTIAEQECTKLPLCLLQCGPHQESAAEKCYCFLLTASRRTFHLSERSAFYNFGSTGRFISFIGTCQARGALLLAGRCEPYLLHGENQVNFKRTA